MRYFFYQNNYLLRNQNQKLDYSFVYSNDHCHKFADGIAKKPIKDLLSRDKVKYNDTKLHVSTPQREFFKNKEILNKIRDLISNGNLEKSGIRVLKTRT